jgi:hypothetical protein
MVSGWKIRLKVTLDVMLHSKTLAKFNHSQRVILPVNALAVLAEVVGLTHLEEVYEAMGCPDNLQTGLHGKGGFQAYPCKDALIMESLESCEAVIRLDASVLTLY